MDVKQKKQKSDRPAAFTQPSPKKLPVETAEIASDPEPKRRLHLTRKKVIISAAIIILLVITLIAAMPKNEPEPVTDGPDYTTILPEGKSVVTLGGWQRVSPPENDAVYAYTDEIDDVSITVSQQPIPAKFGRNASSQVEKLAKGYNATDKITADKTAVYIGTSAKGPQSVILAKDDLLILIKSQKKISNDAWKKYVESLTSANLPNVPKY